ncbi:transglycosylase domain-containing protein [Geomicrobium sp. JCM 19039]|uniref:transglycosylase domain-containing protein n=1 Tax=Geomicrobium sp. JCM 19039 TaxID=1460636 RepID=UPI00045F1C85|nr:transglycosylase domain-containing protein [Geomicrobium sp. JCM 19039]GAK12953.1 multimodular transpeptidase-transglycosylase [Geomicrobium sp. JCM 19039]
MKNILQRFNRWADFIQNNRYVQGLNITSLVAWNILILLSVTILLGTTFVGAAGAGYFVSLVEDEPEYTQEEIRADIYNYEETSVVYFADDVYLGELPSILERREVSLDEVSTHVKDALIATEDEYFFEHNGIVPKAVMRAVFQEFVDTGMQTGGSTLTQQIVKNQMLSNEVSFDRKAREILIAMRLENYMDKDEILEAYLNIVPFGRNAAGTQIAGIQAAANGIFDVEASELSLPQAAYIAGIPQNPFSYTPFTSGGDLKEDLTAGMQRKNIVLYRMLDSGTITEEEYEAAREYDLMEDITDYAPENSFESYPYVTNETERRTVPILRDYLLDKDGVDLSDMEDEDRAHTVQQYTERASTELRLGGYRIHTTIHKDIYDAMEDTIANSELFGPNTNDGQPEQVGGLLQDNETGAILSFIGGRDFEKESWNHATTGEGRSVGSTIKPLMPFGSAMERGVVQPGIVVPDVPTNYRGGDQGPVSNFGGSYAGIPSVRDTITNSRNTPSVRTFWQVPEEDLYDDMIKLGYTPHLDYAAESFALGSFDATVEENTNALSTLATGGTRNESYMIERIETHTGEVIYEHEHNQIDVFSPQTAYLSIDMMRDVLSNGTASRIPSLLNFGGDWAGKTGTSQGARDYWFVGMNPKVSFGLWIGYGDNQPLQGEYSQRQQQLWATLMNRTVETNRDVVLTDSRFEQPEGIVRQSICGVSGLLPSQSCYDAGLVNTDLFNSNYLPSQTDDSLEGARYVTISGQSYLAYEQTPAEFTDTGFSVNSTFFDGVNIQDYLPDSLSGNLVPDRNAPALDHTPAAVSGVSSSGGTISWAQHSDGDIVGYRVYTASGSLVGSVKGNTSTSFSGIDPAQGYYVAAVDTMGRESNPSNPTESVPAPEEPEEDPTEGQEPEESDSTGEGENNGSSDEDNEQPDDQEDGEDNETPPPENDPPEDEDDS